MFAPIRNVALVDLQIDPLGIRLVGGDDLATRRPYPNKMYAVACRKQGQKAINGILIETAKPVEELDYTPVGPLKPSRRAVPSSGSRW